MRGQGAALYTVGRLAAFLTSAQEMPAGHSPPTIMKIKNPPDTEKHALGSSITPS